MTLAHVYIGTSLDGFIARTNGDIDWLIGFADADAVGAYNEFMAGIDVIVIGRGTFEKVLEFTSWPYDKPVFVLSRTLKSVRDALKDKAAVLSLEPEALLAYLSDNGFHSAYVDGGKVIQSFLDANLIETLTIATVPVLIGSGLPPFGPRGSDLSFDHVRTTAYPNGLVRSYYRRKTGDGSLRSN
jgi:dihydrofolate reductase